MIVVMKKSAEEREVNAVVARIEELGYRAHLSAGEERTIIGIIGDERPLVAEPLEALPGVENIMPILEPFKLASRDFKPEPTVFDVDGVTVGGNEIVVIAGPCAVESREQLLETAYAVKEAGAKMLRGGAYKPRTSPYSFQGLGQAGLDLLSEVSEEVGIPTVTEILASNLIEPVANHSAMLQVGARNTQNFALLHDVGKSGKPVMVKRGPASTIQELLMSAEYVLSNRNYNVVVCERGIRTFETATRYTFDINAVPVLKQLTHLPVFVDPSHATGKWNLVGAAAKAGVAAGADGLMIEVHPHPDRALSDGPQALKPEIFSQLMTELKGIAKAIGRKI
jgi:3-deoxy-7-phosphoheptulonate synthase